MGKVANESRTSSSNMFLEGEVISSSKESKELESSRRSSDETRKSSTVPARSRQGSKESLSGARNVPALYAPDESSGLRLETDGNGQVKVPSRECSSSESMVQQLIGSQPAVVQESSPPVDTVAISREMLMAKMVGKISGSLKADADEDEEGSDSESES